MTFNDNFLSTTAKANETQEEVEANALKLVISDDAWAIGSIIQDLINKTEQVRISNLVGRR